MDSRDIERVAQKVLEKLLIIGAVLAAIYWVGVTFNTIGIVFLVICWFAYMVWSHRREMKRLQQEEESLGAEAADLVA